jgi:seryl-tRNA synthetase
VRKLLAGLLDPRLAAVKAQILANEDLLHDFDSAVQLCQRSIDLSVSIPTHARYQVSAVEANNAAEHAVEDRYYQPHEYKQLTKEQRAALHEKRHGRKAVGKDNKKKPGGKGDGKPHKAMARNVKHKMKKMERRISALQSQLKAGADSDSSTSDDEVPKGNSGNPALQRGKAKK